MKNSAANNVLSSKNYSKSRGDSNLNDNFNDFIVATTKSIHVTLNDEDRAKGPILMGQSRDAVGIRITIPCSKAKEAFNSPVRQNGSFRADQSLLLRSQSSKDRDNRFTSTLRKKRNELQDQNNSASRANHDLLDGDKNNRSLIFNVSDKSILLQQKEAPPSAYCFSGDKKASEPSHSFKIKRSPLKSLLKPNQTNLR